VTASRYVVGIDLGTTNCALAYVDTGAGTDEALVPTPFPPPQVVQPGAVETRPLLPSFLYLPGPNELPAGSLKLPWAADRDFAVGEFARNHGAQVPTRLVGSAKSWLCHSGIDRRAAVLPRKAPDTTRKVSPLLASQRYLEHLCEAWNFVVARDVKANRLEQQEIVLTVPASFDAVARELTVEAARAAGLENIVLLEEPQAAFYSWIQASHEGWRKQIEVGDVVLVCDVGGGTTDLTLIAVSEEQGQLALTRIAVGDHILLGGDNMDLALAHAAAKQFNQKGIKLDANQMQMLWYSCRQAKETLLTDPKLASTPVAVLGRGSRVIGGTIKGELSRQDVTNTLVDGFIPLCGPEEEPVRQRAVGLQELGLAYAADPAITKHLAWFLKRNNEILLQKLAARKGRKKPNHPTAVLFNGGVFKAEILRDRVLAALNQWAKGSGSSVKMLAGGDLDLAVARGAAYFGMVRRGKGIRIRGGAARSYYVGVESSMPAVPGAPAPLKALCVVPFGMEEGTEADVPGQEFGLVVGEPAAFRLLSSSVRRQDAVGTLLEEWEGELEELTPLQTTLAAAGQQGAMIPVHLHSHMTNIGTLELSCLSRDAKKSWKLEFNVRESAGNAEE
jgi:molecular chaperone DnaK (HSP70)